MLLVRRSKRVKGEKAQLACCATTGTDSHDAAPSKISNQSTNRNRSALGHHCGPCTQRTAGLGTAVRAKATARRLYHCCATQTGFLSGTREPITANAMRSQPQDRASFTVFLPSFACWFYSNLPHLSWVKCQVQPFLPPLLPCRQFLPCQAFCPSFTPLLVLSLHLCRFEVKLPGSPPAAILVSVTS